MDLKKIKEYSNTILVKLLIVMGVIFITLGWLHTCKSQDKQTSPPVEERIIDSLQNTNTKIIIKVETLDSIKNEKVIEVKNLDNDSTLKLFYELIRE